MCNSMLKTMQLHVTLNVVVECSAPASYAGGPRFMTGAFHGFPQSVEANNRIVPQIRPWLFPSTSFPCHLQ
jgi:hypothetical protein